MKSRVLFLLGCLFSIHLHGQFAEDSLALSLDDVFALARENHPIIRQAALQDDMAAAEIKSAKGQFDPKIQSTYNLKNYKGTEYYNKLYNSLKIPVWFPIDPKVEVYRNSGDYLNRESYVSSSEDYWQVAAGVSLPVGKGLFIDERRSLVKQANLYSNLAEAEKTKLINKTLLTISKSYWDWVLAHRKFQLTTASLTLSQEIFERVKMDYEYGEASVIDTVQAQITFISRQADYEQTSLDLTQARLLLSTHLWNPNNVPLELPDGAKPALSESSTIIVPTDTTLQTLVNWASTNHPEIQKLNTKQQQLEIQQRWNRESLKPELNLSYSLINAPFSPDGFETPQWQDNYKLGMDFSIPIFLRKERGNIQKTRVYQEQTAYTLIQTQLEIAAEIKSTYATLKTNEKLASQYEQMANSYNRLLEAEVFNLENGESDLFKLNVQQDKYIQAQMKAIEGKVKYEKMKYQLPHDAGLPFLSYQKLYE
ncbi:MAG: TolC family protein [Marinoscillum sp.]